MRLEERIYELDTVFTDLTLTNSLVQKRQIIDEIPEILKDDFEVVVECLSGLHKFGYTFDLSNYKNWSYGCNNDVIQTWTIRDCINYLLEPMKQKDLSNANIMKHASKFAEYEAFFEPIVNRTLKLGIGKSILPKDGLSVMLAKKYEGMLKPSKHGYFVTEKLDGNRCVARYDGTKWVFTSRNGKPMHVNFDMSGLPKEYVYDGEILSPEQVKMSQAIYDKIVHNSDYSKKYDVSFNTTSGLINRHDTNKNLVYNIFDIMTDDVEYMDRRNELDKLSCKSNNVRILPTLGFYVSNKEFDSNINTVFDTVVKMGGEGIMINLADSKYEHKRTNGLLKYKQVHTMDMIVYDFEWGSGKYDGAVGALLCKHISNDGKEIYCKVGTGLTDDERWHWSRHENEILGKVVEIGYFSLSQDSNSVGSNKYSLRFPRLIRVRHDKSIGSEY